MACGHLGAKRGIWRTGGVEYPVHQCAVESVGECTPLAGHPSLTSCVGCALRDVRLPRVDVIVTSHNYGHFLDEALTSVYAQDSIVLGRVIVVDDASDATDKTREIAESHGAEYLRVEVKSPHLARGAGFATATAPLVQFLDADNILPDVYLRAAAMRFANNTRLAIVYPDLQRFGLDNGRLECPAMHDESALERSNYIDTGAVWLSEALRQVNAFQEDPRGHEDWWLARVVMRSGKWDAEKNDVPLQYRIHDRQRTKIQKLRDYFTRANLSAETVTIFTTFSARVQKHPELWDRRKEWLRSQTWPRVRLVIANTSGASMPIGWDTGLPALDGVSVYAHEVGTPGLEDRNRAVDRGKTEAAVQSVVAAIYNRMWQETATEFVLIVEDDVFPERTDSIHALMRGFDEQTAGVTGAYQQRYSPYGWTAWTAMPENGRPKLFGQPGRGLQYVEGSGFGCLVLRRSQCAHEVITGQTATSVYYDVDWWHRLAAQGRRCRIHWDVVCDHAGERFSAQQSSPANNATCAHRGDIVRVEKCQLCASQAGPKGTPVEIRKCDIHGTCAPWRYKSGQTARSCSTCADYSPLVQLSLASSSR